MDPSGKSLSGVIEALSHARIRTVRGWRAYTESVKSNSRFSVVRGALGLVERVHLFLKYTEHSYMVLVAIAIGMLGGLGAVGFRECIRLFQLMAWHTDLVTLDYLRNLPSWWKVVAPAVGGLIVGAIIVRFAAEAKSSRGPPGARPLSVAS